MPSVYDEYIGGRMKRARSGATATEYGLLAALISVVVLAAMSLLGTRLIIVFYMVASILGNTKISPYVMDLFFAEADVDEDDLVDELEFDIFFDPWISANIGPDDKFVDYDLDLSGDLDSLEWDKI
jgi:pilus assembly protein Flp/PilA